MHLEIALRILGSLLMVFSLTIPLAEPNGGNLGITDAVFESFCRGKFFTARSRVPPPGPPAAA